MNLRVLMEAYKHGLTIQHKNNGIYIVEEITEVKIKGEWLTCITYRGILTQALYVRCVDDFENFEVYVDV